ncbi:disulfide bond formation protein B [Sphaerotilus uruguayifluvii]|uniref:Disulfide bond formation protein DsbB n=1 Tax=Sphaerotilus uruguayifluvii TaxID=2735897 RepID=A0ABX2G1L4_9BURK|nr:disulfide bond formation protein B [Leptothrix sp. C29]NRT56190.1 disulfide bond formation protein DsbB [Leptothrix sp. C29]
MSLTALPARHPRATLALIALACVASVAAALFAQHRLDMQPCPWCILQRILFLLIAAVATLAAALPEGLGAALSRRLSALLVALLALAGAAAALYQHFVAAKLPSCDLTLADRLISGLGLDAWLPEVFEVRASCAEAAVSVLGVPFEFWSAALYLTLALLGLLLLVRPVERPRAVFSRR